MAMVKKEEGVEVPIPTLVVPLVAKVEVAEVLNVPTTWRVVEGTVVPMPTRPALEILIFSLSFVPKVSAPFSLLGTKTAFGFVAPLTPRKPKAFTTFSPYLTACFFH